MIDQSRHNDAAPEASMDTVSKLSLRRPWFERLRLQLQVEREIDDLTRDHEREQRVLAEAAIRLPSDGLAIGMLFHARSRRVLRGRAR